MNNTTTKQDTWKIAQANEYAVWRDAPPNHNDDWNQWWYERFDKYAMLKNKNLTSIIEVGCGPYAKNIQYIIHELSQPPKNIGLNDPLLNEYININKPVATYIHDIKARTYNCSLEELIINEKYDCVICINVLSHVYDVNKCMNNLYNLLNSNGIIILGEDLTNDEDLISAPEILTDKMHPIRFNEEEIQKYLNKYRPLMYKTLNREEGRNPRAHYKTLLFSGTK